MAKTTTQASGDKSGARTGTEAIYAAHELANAARTLFHAPPELVAAALKMAGKTKATMAEARRIVKDFMSTEVR